MAAFRYPKNVLVGDYLRGGGGFAVSAGLLMLASTITLVQYIIAAAAILFGGYAVRTMIRHMTSYEIGEEGIWANGPFGRAIRWEEISEIKLRYFSTRRDRAAGWFQLTVKGAPGSVSVDSTLDGFDQILESCALAARRNELELSEMTVENFAAAGRPIRSGAAGATSPGGELGAE